MPKMFQIGWVCTFLVAASITIQVLEPPLHLLDLSRSILWHLTTACVPKDYCKWRNLSITFLRRAFVQLLVVRASFSSVIGSKHDVVLLILRTSAPTTMTSGS